MTREEIINNITAMGFRLDYDRWDVGDEGWMRFVLKKELDESTLRLIWWRSLSDTTNFSRAAEILFKAGQKAKIQQLNEYVNL